MDAMPVKLVSTFLGEHAAAYLARITTSTALRRAFQPAGSGCPAQPGTLGAKILALSPLSVDGSLS